MPQKKEWEIIDWDSCPECGDAIQVLSSAEDQFVHDGDEAVCSDGCGYKSAYSVDEDGSAWLQD